MTSKRTPSKTKRPPGPSPTREPAQPGQRPASDGAKGRARDAVSPSKVKAKPKAKHSSRKTPARGGAHVAAIFQRFADANPHPKGELEFTNAFTLLVAVVLSAQATDRGVNLATRELFRLADTPEKMCALGEDRVRELIKTIGLYRNKAKNVIALSEKLIAEYDSQVPADRAALESLPGVGRKTANVVLNIFFGQPTMAVDTHVFRVSHRLGLSQGKDPLAVETDLVRIIPEDFAMHAHHWLILHGRYVCKARAPDCAHCAVAEFCPSRIA